MALPGTGWGGIHSSPTPAFCALHRGGAQGLLLLDRPEPREWEAQGAEVCEVTTCDCQQQRKEEWGRWWQRSGRLTTAGVRLPKRLQSEEK